MVKSCHGAAPSSLLCGLARLLWLDPTFGVISRCLCVYTYIPIDEKTCGFGRLLLLAVLKGLCRLWRPTDATNTSIPKQTAAYEDDKAPRTSMTLAAFLLRDYGPKRLRTVWRWVKLQAEVREFFPGSALSASLAAGVCSTQRHADASPGSSILWTFRSFYSRHHRSPTVQLVRG